VELDGPIILALIYGALALLKRVGDASKRRQGGPGMPPVSQRPTARKRPAPKTMEELLREMAGEAPEEEAEPEPIVRAPTTNRLPVPSPTPWEWEVEERGTLETDPTVVSTETAEAFDRPVPVRLDYDNDAEALAQRRVTAAASRDGALRPDDHRRFDAKIREVAPVVQRAPVQGGAMRRAMIWHEVLSKPVSLRDEE
jgi:hypothetical protein